MMPSSFFSSFSTASEHLLLLAWGLLLLGTGLLSACAPPVPPGAGRPAAPGEALLVETWEGYRQRFILPDGRVVRPLDAMDTVSEGQAYALLRAVWMNDRETFDRVYAWTEANLSRRTREGDALLAWHWGRRGDGTWGVLDWTAAADADEDYALALLFAAKRWGSPGHSLPPYREQAIRVLAAILAKETRRARDGRLYLVPGDQPGQQQLLNPSYLAPAWYRIFAEATGDPAWRGLIESSYHAIQSLARGLGKQRGVGLMPDWARLTPDGTFDSVPGMSDAHGWDAFRTPWRVALDWRWFNEPRAHRYLVEHLVPFLEAEWLRNEGKLFIEYAYAGKPLATYESTAAYGAYLPALQAAGSPLAETIRGRIRGAVRRDPGGAFFDLPEDYYLNNWAWFGLLAGEGMAVNLW